VTCNRVSNSFRSGGSTTTAVAAGISELDLANAITQTPGIVAGASFVAQPPEGLPHDVQTTSLGGFPTDASTYAILTSGDATLADTPNSSGSSGANDGGPNVRGNTDYDVTILKVDLNVP